MPDQGALDALWIIGELAIVLFILIILIYTLDAMSHK